MTDNYDFDINAFAAKFIQENINNLAETSSQFAGGVKARIARSLQSTYSKYVSRILEHYGTARTFFLRNSKAPLYNYYVPLDIRIGPRSVEAASISSLRKTGNHVVLAGQAGCGKSTLMRHLLVDSIKVRAFTPVFVELNQLNNHDSIDLWATVIQCCERHGLKLSANVIKEQIEAGFFALLLDGVDEIEDNIRVEALTQIDEIATQCPNTMIVVSTRPDDICSILKNFNIFEVEPLSLEKAVELVEKLPFDEQIKEKFVNDLRAKLYKLHRTLLSNPLLLSIMLLTFGQSASIPSNLSIFYKQAYEALFQTHDAYKGGFSRRRKSGLDIVEFERAFAAFSLITYSEHAHTFTKLECLSFMERAMKIASLTFSPAELLDDCLLAVNLLMMDGLKVAFVHRSFQEYFAARYITRLTENQKEQILSRFALRGRSEQLLDRYWELDLGGCERYFVIPAIESLKLVLKLKNKPTRSGYVRYVKLFCDEISHSTHEIGGEGLRLHFAQSPDQAGDRALLYITAWFVFRRYWRDYRQRSAIAEKDAAVVAKGDWIVTTASLTLRSSDLKRFDFSDGIIGSRFYEFMIGLPALIRKERKAEVEAIEDVLGLN